MTRSSITHALVRDYYENHHVPLVLSLAPAPPVLVDESLRVEALLLT